MMMYSICFGFMHGLATMVAMVATQPQQSTGGFVFQHEVVAIVLTV